MHRVTGHIGLLLLASWLAAAVSAETDLAGEIGIDLNRMSYSTDYADTSTSYGIRRNQSNYYLNTVISGPLVNDYFANYGLTMRLRGSYVNSRSDFDSKTNNIQPGLKGFHGTATFLPQKPFPFQIYRSTATDDAIRYEANNRSDRERLQPALSIVRRYESEREVTGATWQVVPSDKVRFFTEYKEEKARTSRLYDFGENLDIWVTFINSAAGPGDTVFTVLFDNKLPDTADIEVANLDSLNANPGFATLSIADLPPGHTEMVYLYPGRTEIQIASSGFNPYYTIITVDSNLVISMNYRDPAAPNDIEQNRNVFATNLKLGADNTPFKSAAFYEYLDQHETVQKQSTFMHNFSNMARYTVSNLTDLSAYSSLQDNRTRIDTISVQWNRVLMHQTALNYLKREGISGSLSHTFSGSSSNTVNPSAPVVNPSGKPNDTLKTTLHSFTGRLTYPSRKYNHRLDLRIMTSLLSDNSGYVNDQYIADVINSMDVRKLGTQWQPTHQFRYSFNSQGKPRQKSQEIENKIGVMGRKSVSLLGGLRFKGEWTYRYRWDEIGTDRKNRYLMEMQVTRKIGAGYRIALIANKEWEITSGSAQVFGGSAARKVIAKSALKLDIHGMITKDLSLGGNAMFIGQGENSIDKYGLALNTVIPVVKIPVKSLLLAESRRLKGQDPQTMIGIDTKISHRFREVTLVLRHVYKRERLLFETYTVNEIYGTVSRQFNVL